MCSHIAVSSDKPLLRTSTAGVPRKIKQKCKKLIILLLRYYYFSFQVSPLTQTYFKMWQKNSISLTEANNYSLTSGLWIYQYFGTIFWICLSYCSDFTCLLERNIYRSMDFGKTNVVDRQIHMLLFNPPTQSSREI